MFLISSAQQKNSYLIHQPPDASFRVSCPYGVDGPDEIQDALAEGWRDIIHDPDPAERHSGICPDCR